MISIQKVTKKFGSLTAVNDLTLEVEAGEIFGLLGPNGAGKTTTLKMLVGLVKPTVGEIYIDSYNIAKESIQTKKVLSFIPDQPFVYKKLTGYEFLRFISDSYEIPVEIVVERIKKLAELFEISEVLPQMTESYSHGMRQKLLYTAAMLHNPKVIIVDEPMIGLDPKSTHLVKEIFVNLSNSGKTIFISTHTLSLAQEICHRVAIIDHGKLVALQSPDKHLEEVFLCLTGVLKKKESLEEFFFQ